MTRLPIPGDDAGTWGALLNSFLKVEHNDDGTLKQSATIASAEQIARKGAANGYASLNASGVIPTVQMGNNSASSSTFLRGDSTWASVPSASDATDSTKGVIQLAGDLSGTASVPTVNGLARVFNVKDYGAIGDGVTNDFDAIQSAINAAASNGGIVFLPEGVYIIDPADGGIQLGANISFVGVGYDSVLRVSNASNSTNNLLKIESKSNVYVNGLRLDGNREAQTSGTNYGLYIAGSTNCVVDKVWSENFTGVGIHVYDSDAVMLSNCFSSKNVYHGYEFEQARYCSLSNSRGNNNDMHGILVSPGEVGGSGAKGNKFVNCSFDTNGNYGIAMNAANDDISAFLNEGNMFNNCNATDNAYYGLNIYKQDKQIFNNLYIARNGFMGVYLYQSAYNVFSGLYLHNNSQIANGTYDEILMEGYNDGHASAHNVFNGGMVLIDGSTKARWAISEGTSGDGDNIFNDISIPYAGTQSAKINIQSSISSYGHVDITTNQSIGGLKTFGDGLAVGPNSVLPGSSMGFDAPFGEAAFRMYTDVGNLQFVSASGTADWYIGGDNIFSVASSYAALRSHPLKEVADPTDAQDAATKNYVDVNKVAKTGSDDIVVADSSKGLILTDRTLSTMHRLYINNGVLSVETI